MVSIFQYAFVEGKQILDPIIIASETIDSRIKKGSNSGTIGKLDIKKV